MRSPFPFSFPSSCKCCILKNGASAQSAKELVLTAGKRENEGFRRCLRPPGWTWEDKSGELGSIIIPVFQNLAQLPQLTMSPNPGVALLGTHDPCPWLPGLAERFLSSGPIWDTHLDLRQVQAPMSAGDKGQSRHRAHLLQPRGLCGGDTDADAEESRERCPEGQSPGQNGYIPEVSRLQGQKLPDQPLDLSWRSERREAEAKQLLSVPRAWPILNAKPCGQLWPEALSLSVSSGGLPTRLRVLAPAPLSPEAGWVTSDPCSLLRSLTEGQAYSRWLGTLPCHSLSCTNCSVTQWLFSLNID